ncbi:hypothetical protein V5799_003589 [Amblyomma americanum]|uniref:Uncharacterized protein n=1 Tax=Amblyomma americanum TaxID=6943 RepID=A0AAQ4D8I9_AMBAM
MPTGPGPGLYHHFSQQRQGPMVHGIPPGVRPPPYPTGTPYTMPPGYPGPGAPPQLRHLLNQGPMNQKGTPQSMAALSHMARMGPSAAGGSYTLQKGIPQPHPAQGMRPQPGMRQQHGVPSHQALAAQQAAHMRQQHITISPVTTDKSRPVPVSSLPRPPPLASGLQIIAQSAPKVIMLDSAAARAAAFQQQQQQQQMRRVSSNSRDGTPPSINRLPPHIVASTTNSRSGSPRLPETSVLERALLGAIGDASDLSGRNSAITITPVGAGPSSSSSSSSRTASPSVSVVRIKEEPKSPSEQQLPSCSGDAGPSSNTLRSSSSPAETVAGIASRSLNDFANRSIGNLLQSSNSKDSSQEKVQASVEETKFRKDGD